jgi:large subunit ribosomal protein L23
MAKKKVEEAKVVTASAASLNDFDVIINPIITEKSMKLLQDENKVTLKVKTNANKIQIKSAFEKLFKVEATQVQICNTADKSTTRGGRYAGILPGYKKAIVTVKDGEAIDLYKD